MSQKIAYKRVFLFLGIPLRVFLFLIKLMLAEISEKKKKNSTMRRKIISVCF